MLSWFRRYLLPGLVFQSMCIAGGYGTGRELVEFFLNYGPIGGYLGMIPATIVVSLVCMVAFELARITRTYDYRSFLRILLGRFWVIYEVAYLLTILLILAVLGSAVGAIFTETFGLPAMTGTVVLLFSIAILAFFGSRVIEGVMSIWSFVLYAMYLAMFILSMCKFGSLIVEVLETTSPEPGWLSSGMRYGALQLGLLPAILFATTHIQKRKEAFIAGALTGPLLMIPAALFFAALVGSYPDILQRPVPVNHILETLGSPLLLYLFPIVLIGTFIETGTGMIHALNERVANAFTASGRDLNNWVRPLIAVALIISAILMSRWGIIDLIAVGYNAMAWVFVLVVVVPLFSVGLWKITRPKV
jgi:uncharacterized membrane protein YkvI